MVSTFEILNLGCHLISCLFLPGNSLTPNWCSSTGCAWSKPPSAWCSSSWSTAACQITFEVSGVSLLRRPCWACAWMCVRAWPTWKRRVSSTETWYEQAQGPTPPSTGPKNIPLKCSSAKSERASLSSAPHMAFPPLSLFLLHPLQEVPGREVFQECSDLSYTQPFL